MFVCYADFPVGKPFALAPGNVLRNGAALFLRQRRHDRYEQFALAVQSVDVFFLKVYLDALFFEFTNGHQTVDRISCEAADAFCDDEVNFSDQRIAYHLIEPIALLCVDRRDSFVRIHTDELPVRLVLNVARIVVHLCFIAGHLFLAVGGNTGVASHAPLCRRHQRHP
ncbi:hypothetical protein SDC9_192016 [bioreactor metagenome]|uniref:Uncharacterized protein n=1 Tax=bioreactor metagenome TaxID=1076179 RepID=A0A645HZH3_9ZZZZ